MKQYIIIAGVNGAGKTTLFDTNSMFEEMPRVNLDEIVRSFGSWKNRADVTKAGLMTVNKIKNFFEAGISFNQETTLCGKSIFNNIRRAKDNGYIIELYYVGLGSAELAKERVRQRVANGGHGISDEDVERRYVESLTNLPRAISMSDVAQIYDNTESFSEIAKFVDGKCMWSKQQLPKWYEEYVLKQI